MEAINFLPSHMLTYCITVDLGTIVLKCKTSALSIYSIENPIFIGHVLEKQLELPSDKGSNQSRGATRDIGRGPFM